MNSIARFTALRISAVVLAVVASCTTFVVGAQTTAPADAKASTGMSAGGDVHASMMPSMQQMQSMQATGDADKDFASVMKIHHQGAVDMAQAELKSGRDPKLRQMAKKIIASQQQEIKEFDAWLARSKQGGTSSGHK